MTFRLTGFFFVLYSCAINGPEAAAPTGLFTVESDCPGSAHTGTTTISIDRDKTVMKINDGVLYGFPAEDVQISFKPGAYDLTVGSAEHSCSAYWERGLGNTFMFVCKSQNSIECSIKLAQYEEGNP